MSEATHTPEPWKNDNGLVTGMDSRARFSGSPSIDIFDASGWPEELHDEALATAALISAAPAMLRALREIVVMCEGPVQVTGAQRLSPFELAGSVSKCARAALSKARG